MCAQPLGPPGAEPDASARPAELREQAPAQCRLAAAQPAPPTRARPTDGATFPGSRRSARAAEPLRSAPAQSVCCQRRAERVSQWVALRRDSDCLPILATICLHRFHKHLKDFKDHWPDLRPPPKITVANQILSIFWLA